MQRRKPFRYATIAPAALVGLRDGEGVTNDGKPYRNTYTWYLQFRGEKVIKATAFFNTVEFNDFWQRMKPKSSP